MSGRERPYLNNPRPTQLHTHADALEGMAVQRTTVMERQTGSWLLPLLGTLMLVCCTSAEA